MAKSQSTSRQSRIVRLARDAQPVLLVVIDTEEEFDWSRAFDRQSTAVSHMRDIARLQAVFDEFAIRPVYVIDYPIATQPESAEPLRAIHAAGRCEIGAHLHPWVSPPHEEEVNARNSYPGNLPRDLERRKLEALGKAIEAGLGVRPKSYKAGRYGFGPHTAEALIDLGFEVDLSPYPPFDLRADGGPDWSGVSPLPHWLGPSEDEGAKSLLSIPTTGGYVGFAGEAHGLYQLATRPELRWARLPGVLARIRALERLHLSPEGYAPEHHRRITRALHRRGVRTFTFSLHSPSVKPGCTPYVRNERELVQFLDNCRWYFEFFFKELGGTNMTALELRRHVEEQERRAPVIGGGRLE